VVGGVLIRPLIVVNMIVGVCPSDILSHLLLTLLIQVGIDIQVLTKVVLLSDSVEQRTEAGFEILDVDVRSRDS
jgi:hypothetical protein